MGGRPRRSPLRAALPLLVLASLTLLAVNASAQYGTTTVQLRVNALGAEASTMPVAVPELKAGNPANDGVTVQRAVQQAARDRAPVATPVWLENNADGFYVATAGGTPVRVVAWAPGLEQYSVAPLRYLDYALGADDDLPINAGIPVPPAPSPTADGDLKPQLTVPVLAPGTPGTSLAAARAPVNEAPPVVATAEALAGEPLPYQAPLAAAGQEDLRPASAGPAARAVGGMFPFVAVAAGAALLLLLLPLYHRFKRKTALDNPTRAMLYEQLREAPGASAAQLAEAAGLHVTTVKYHLDVLRRVGMVGEELVDGCRRFYSYENGDRATLLERALLDEPAARAVFRQIAQHPGLPFIEVARSLGMRKEHVHYHVQKLAKHGLISDKWEGGRRLLFPGSPATPSPDGSAKGGAKA